VKTIRYPFRINVGFLIHQSIGVSHCFPFAFERIHIADDLNLTDFKGAATVSRTPQGLLVQGTFEGCNQMECGRCLKPFMHTLKWEMTELYAFNRRTATKEDLLLPDDGFIDLESFIVEDAQIALPINPICKPDCLGLCQICGADLNLGDCGHDDAPPENENADLGTSPFSGLKDLLER
jgi:uncharacterized protein